MWVGEVAAAEGADTVTYQVFGVAAELTSNPGPGDRAILGLEGFGFWGAALVAPAPSGRARIVVDPTRVVADTTSGSVTFRDGAAPVARYSALVREYREEDERLAERAAALRKAGQAVPGVLYDRPARLARVAARLETERDLVLRARLAQRVFWLSLDDSLPIAPTLLRTAAVALNARSPAWGAFPDEYGTALIQLAVRAGPPPARADQFPLMDSAVARRALAVADSVLAQPSVPSGVREGVSALAVHAANFARLHDSAGVRYRQFARDYPWSWELRALRTQFDAARTVAAGRPVPAFRFVALGDSARTITNAALSGHKLTLVDFWAVWCGPCAGEMPNIERAYAKYGTRGLQVLSVSLDDSRASMAAFRRDKHAMPWVHA